MERSSYSRYRGACLAALIAAASPLPTLAETELSLYSGWQGAAPGRLVSSSLGERQLRWEGRPFSMPPYYGARATWWRDNGLGVGVEVNHAKVYAPDPPALGYERLEFSDGLNLVTVNLWLRLDTEGKVRPYAGVGLGVAVPHVDIRPAGQAHTFGYQLTGPAAQWVVGASVPLSDRWAVFGEYKGTYSANHVRLDSGGTIDANVRTQSLNLGLSLRF